MAAVAEKARKAAVPLPGERTQGETIAYLLAALTIGAAGLYLIQDLFAPAFFALTLVVTVRPLVSWMTRHRVPRVVAATAAIVLIFAFVVLLFAALAVAVAQLVDTLPQYAPKFQAIWKQVETQLNGMGVDQSAVLKQVTNVLDTSQLVMVAQPVLGQLTSASAMMGVMSMVVVFLMFDTAKIEIRTAALGVLKPGMASALVSFCEAVRSYWMVSTVFGLIVAVINAVTLWYLNVPMAITWGVVSFITNYIPNIGFVLGVVPPAILGLVDSGPWTALWVVLSYTAANFVIQSLIQPKFTGDAVGLNTTTTFLCLLFWSTVTGAMGTILAVPLTLFVKALLIDSDPRSRWVGIFLSAGDSPVRDPDELDQGVLDQLDLDGDGVGESDPDYGRAVVEKHAEVIKEREKAGKSSAHADGGGDGIGGDGDDVGAPAPADSGRATKDCAQASASAHCWPQGEPGAPPRESVTAFRPENVLLLQITEVRPQSSGGERSPRAESTFSTTWPPVRTAGAGTLRFSPRRGRTASQTAPRPAPRGPQGWRARSAAPMSPAS